MPSALSLALLTVLWLPVPGQADPPPESNHPDAATAAVETTAAEPAAPSTLPRADVPAGPDSIARPLPPAQPDDDGAMVIREPSQARPIFIAPEGEFYFVMRVTPTLRGSDVSFSLVHAQEPAVRVPLGATTPPSFVNSEMAQFANLVLRVPARAAPGLYDLEVRSNRGAYVSRRSVRVVDRFRTKFRFVHLSNMNVGDPTAPDFDPLLPPEVNLLAPEFIVATGNFTEWSRARNDPSSWKAVLDYLAKFDAPVFVVCGPLDHQDSFTTLVASSPIGTLDYGDYHGLLLLDHPGHPVDQDYDQLRWIDADLQKNRNKRLNFIVGHSDEMALLDAWRERGDLAAFLDRSRIRLYVAGGSTDWDYTEFKDKLAGLDDFHFVRTHQSSTCLRDRATGVSHYRVIEVDGDGLSYVYPDDVATEPAQHSVPSGRLRVFYDRENNGAEDRIIATVQNGLNQAFPAARLWLRVAKSAGSLQPAIAGGRLVRALDAGRHWACEIEADLPEKGAVRVMAANSPGALPAEVPVTISWDGPTELEFAPRTTDFGLRYYACPAGVELGLTNTSAAPVTCWPIIRLNGSQLRADPKRTPKFPLTLEPGAPVRLPLLVNLRRVSEGPHLVQVHFLDDPLARLTTFPVTLRQRGAAAAPTEESKDESKDGG